MKRFHSNLLFSLLLAFITSFLLLLSFSHPQEAGSGRWGPGLPHLPTHVCLAQFGMSGLEIVCFKCLLNKKCHPSLHNINITDAGLILLSYWFGMLLSPAPSVASFGDEVSLCSQVPQTHSDQPASACQSGVTRRSRHTQLDSLLK